MKKLLSLLLCAVMVLSMVACSAKPAATDPSGDKPDASGAPADGEKIELRFSWWGNEVRNKATIEAIELFEKKHPNIKVTPEYSGYDGYRDKLMAQIAGKNAPDIFTSVTEWYPALTDSEAMYDITGMFDMSGHNDAVIEACSFDKKVYGVSVALSGYGFTYNKTLADELGVTIPEKMIKGEYTWDDLVDVCADVYKKSGGKTYGMVDGTFYGVMFESFGYTYLQKPWPFPWDNEKLTTTAEDVTAYFDYFTKVPEGVLMPPAESYNIDPGTQCMVAQRKAMFLFAAAGGFASHQSQTKDELGFVPLPVGPKGETANTSRPGLILNVYSQSEHPKEAAMFLDFFTNDPECAKILKTCRGVLPTKVQRDAVLNAPDLLDRNDKILFDFVNTIFAKDTLVFLPGPLGAEQLREDLMKTIAEAVGFGKLTPQAAGEKYMKEAAEILGN